MEDVKLLSFWASPFAMRAILALESKGVQYELIEEDLAVKSQLLLQSNPVYKKVPVLLHNGETIPESLVIVRYDVDEAWPAGDGFFPTDPYGRAITQFWSDFIDKKIFEVAFKVMKCKGSEEKEAALKELHDNIITLERAIIKLNAKPFLNGSNIGFANICLAPFVAWLAAFEEVASIRIPSAEEAPHFHNFCSAIFELPTAKVAFPHPQNLLAFGRMLQQRWNPST